MVTALKLRGSSPNSSKMRWKQALSIIVGMKVQTIMGWNVPTWASSLSWVSFTPDTATRLLGLERSHMESNNVSAVNEALNEIYVEEEDYDMLRESIDLHDNFDQIGLAQKIEKHELLEMRHVAAYIYKKAGTNLFTVVGCMLNMRVFVRANWMEVAFSGDTTRLSYRLTWEFLPCLLPVFTSIIVSSILIWNYEGSDNSERATSLYDGESWMPCLKGLSPFWLMGSRMISFCLILAASIADVATHGTNLFY
ncbi:unnamed protein product [Lactuca saligna]|uniref:Uncharacterized protein n=1 Tax=Lactuca saligna TaxID=75948 RepID=A0AA35UZG9_LACSI|nr:unnamed protein product [Lactuca saligna]